jgi:hypothetical protein
LARRLRSKAFIITVGDKPRLLFRISETKRDLDLTVVIRHAPYAELHAVGGLRPKHAEHHISIHNSYKSPTQINVITLRTRIEGQSELIPVDHHFTAAIKQHANYAPVFTQRCSDLSGGYFLYDHQDDDVISLGEYDPSHFQLL